MAQLNILHEGKAREGEKNGREGEERKGWRVSKGQKEKMNIIKTSGIVAKGNVCKILRQTTWCRRVGYVVVNVDVVLKVARFCPHRVLI